MTDLTTKLTNLLTAIQDIEGVSIAPEDNKLAYLRLISGVPFESLLESLVLNSETLVSAAQLYLQNNTSSRDPNFTGVVGCATTLGSAASVVASDGRTYASWVTLPPNTTLVDLDSIVGAQGLQSLLSSYWDGVKMYVKAPVSTFRLSPYDTQDYPTGRIITIHNGSDIAIAPSMVGAGEITVYFCTEMLETPSMPLIWDSSDEPITGYSNRQQINWGDFGSLGFPWGAGYSTSPVILWGNFNGWGFRQTAGGSGGGFRVAYWESESVVTSFNVSLGVTNYISVDTVALLIDDNFINNSFSVTLVPPA